MFFSLFSLSLDYRFSPPALAHNLPLRRFSSRECRAVALPAGSPQPRLYPTLDSTFPFSVSPSLLISLSLYRNLRQVPCIFHFHRCFSSSDISVSQSPSSLGHPCSVLCTFPLLTLSARHSLSNSQVTCPMLSPCVLVVAQSVIYLLLVPPPPLPTCLSLDSS